MNTLYFVEFDNKHAAYSTPPSRYNGDLNWNEVATDPSSDRTTSSGFKDISEKGITFCVGYPLVVDLICKVTGTPISSLLLKKQSNLVK